MLLGVYEEGGKLRYVRQVAAQFTPRQERELEARQLTLCRKRPPIASAPEPEADREFHWVEPGLVAEASFPMDVERVIAASVFSRTT